MKFNDKDETSADAERKDSARESATCVRPWTHLQIRSSGLIHFCCDASPGRILDEGGRVAHVLNYKNEFLTSPNLRNIRNEMTAGRKPVECIKCWTTERSGGRSLRQKMNAAWSSQSNDELKLQTVSRDQPKLRSIELRLGNICNLKCRMCGPANSTKWYEDYQKWMGLEYFKEDGVPYSIHKSKQLFGWHKELEITKWINDNAPNVTEIQFVGGEPLLSPSHVPLLEHWVSKSLAPHISLRYTTNATVVDEKLFALWSHFKEVTVSLSIDGIGAVYEYIRNPANWAEVKDNIFLFEKEVGKSVARVSIQPTPNVFNIFDILPLAQWVDRQLENIEWTTHLNFQEGPAWQSAYILNRNDRIEIANQINEFVDQSKVRKNTISNWLRGLSKRLLLKDWMHLQKEFILKNESLDKIRNESLRLSCPNVYKSIYQSAEKCDIIV